jgi:hypothetical protein
MFALNSLRIEKGYRAWKGDLSTDYTVLQGGLDRFIDWDHDFRGRAALQAERQRGVSKRFVTLIVEAGEHDPPYMSTLWHDGQVVGETTSGYWGHRVDACIALGMLRADLAVPGTELEVEIFGQRFPATVQPDGPLWDPGEREAAGVTDLPKSARVVIIGGGVSGCSVAYHLAHAGWTDIVLLERKQLTCGTTWHAAGLIGQLRGSQNMTRLAKYSADLYLRLEAETGIATGMRQVGSISVALTRTGTRNCCAAHAGARLSMSRCTRSGRRTSRRCIRI